MNINASSKIKDPLAKALYAMAWKKNDLIKFKHILKGANSTDHSTQATNKDALVFYYFGKHLSNSTRNPIIDQHVMRAFAIHKSTKKNVAKFRKSDSVDKGMIHEYIEWVRSLKEKWKNVPDEYTYHIDKVLFAAGKAVKIKKGISNK